MLRNSALKRLFRYNKSIVSQQQPRRNYQKSSFTKSMYSTTPVVLVTAGLSYWAGTQYGELSPQALVSDVPQVSIPGIPTHATVAKAFRDLTQILPSEHVTLDEETLQNHGYSNNSYHNEGAPNIVVYPSSTEQVAAIVKIADKYNMPIIPLSGGTSLEGHFCAPRGGICISFSEHMDQIIAFHPEDMDIVVQPGVQWEDLNLYLKKEKLFYPLDPGPG